MQKCAHGHVIDIFMTVPLSQQTFSPVFTTALQSHSQTVLKSCSYNSPSVPSSQQPFSPILTTDLQSHSQTTLKSCSYNSPSVPSSQQLFSLILTTALQSHSHNIPSVPSSQQLFSLILTTAPVCRSPHHRHSLSLSYKYFPQYSGLHQPQTLSSVSERPSSMSIRYQER